MVNVMNKQQEYYKVIADLWQYMKRHLPADNTDNWAKSVVEDARSFAAEHGATKFAQELASAALWELDRTSKR